jgi:hypothetical protein
MLVAEMALEIRLLAKRGKGLRAIAREVGVSRNTVRRCPRDGHAEQYRLRPQRSGKLAGLVAYLCRSGCSFRLPGVRRPGGFCLPKLNAFGAGYRSR